jgi:hypothetical protein
MNMALGAIKQQTLIRFLCLFILTMSLVVLVERGIETVALALIIFYFIQFIASYFLLNGKFNFGWRKLIDLLWAPLFSAGVMYFVVIYIVDSGWFELRLLNFISAIVCGVFTYFFLFLVIPSSSWNYLRKNILNKVLRKN